MCDNGILLKLSWRYYVFNEKQEKLCDKCKSNLVPITEETCIKCSRPVNSLSADYYVDGVCYDCQRWEESSQWTGMLAQNVSVFEYNEFMKNVVNQWKFRGDYVVIEAFRQSLLSTFSKHYKDNDLYLVPIPLSEKRLYERGFNQSAALAELLDYPIVNLLKRTESEEKQSQKSREERIHTSSPFSLTSELHSLQDKHIVLIDDIYTTGTTLRHAAKTLSPHTSKRIRSFTLIRS
ncbi:ComF family protein [Bacillus solimangrovi]|uniref:Phosphoribosyltransferase domain-containing protein n=1 Tax=Bacillus solimangrovi TaxID=1305675 RepID=A0A1E5LDN3_9BACI|nr:ComF family protein [Bacillus solimangrovi]OEH92195.1 hypothetical protein BFG57_02685 [Bacillus solimangrovi]